MELVSSSFVDKSLERMGEISKENSEWSCRISCGGVNPASVVRVRRGGL